MRIRKCQEPVTNAVIITLCRSVKKERHNHRVALACGHLFDVGIKATKRVLKIGSPCVFT